MTSPWQRGRVALGGREGELLGLPWGPPVFGGEEAGGDGGTAGGGRAAAQAQGGRRDPSGTKWPCQRHAETPRSRPAATTVPPQEQGRGTDRDGSRSPRDAAGQRAGCEDDRRATARGHLAQRFVVLFLNVSDKKRAWLTAGKEPERPQKEGGEAGSRRLLSGSCLLRGVGGECPEVRRQRWGQIRDLSQGLRGDWEQQPRWTAGSGSSSRQGWGLRPGEQGVSHCPPQLGTNT